MEADSDIAVFPNVDISVILGSRDHQVPCKIGIVSCHVEVSMSAEVKDDNVFLALFLGPQGFIDG